MWKLSWQLSWGNSHMGTVNAMPTSIHLASLTPHILNLLKAGYYPAKISKILKINKGTLSKWLAKLEKQGMIERNGKTVPQFYIVKQTQVSNFTIGDRKRIFLQKIPSFSQEFPYVEVPKLIRLHNLEFSYPIIKDAKVPAYKTWALKSHTQIYGKTKWGSYIKTNKTLRVFPKPEWGADSKELEVIMRNKAEKIRDFLQVHFGLVCDYPKQTRKPHFATKDAYAKMVYDKLEFSNECGKIDNSEGEDGEIDWYSAEYADSYLKMPSKLDSLEKEIVNLREVIKGGITQQQTINQILSMLVHLQQQVLYLTKKLEEREKHE